MINAVEAFGDINFQRILRPKPDRVEESSNGIPTRASRAKAIGMRRQFGFPFGFQGLSHDRLSCPFILGWNAKRAFFCAAPLGYPGASQWCGLAIETNRFG
jgi:hypothetical protein